MSTAGEPPSDQQMQIGDAIGVATPTPSAELRPRGQLVSEFWRVGRFEDPLRTPLAERQGAGRFDDPQRLVGVLYGADSERTALFETMQAQGISAHPEAEAIRNNIPPPEMVEDSSRNFV